MIQKKSKKNKLIGFDFEYSSKTGRLHNIGLENELKNLGWDVLKPKENQIKSLYWLRVLIDIISSKSNYLFWMPSYKVVIFLFPIFLVSRNFIFLGIRDLWYGNPQPISSIKGRAFNKFGYFVFYLFSKFCKVKWIVISCEMKNDLIKYHSFIKENNVIVSSTGDIKRKISKNLFFEFDLGYFGTLDLQMDFKKYKELKSNFKFVHYGLNDFEYKVDGYIRDQKLLDIQINKCKLLVIFGVNDYSRLNRKIFHLLQTSRPILYFGPSNNVTYRILSNYRGVYFNPTINKINKILLEEFDYSRDLKKYFYINIAKKLNEDICNSTS